MICVIEERAVFTMPTRSDLSAVEEHSTTSVMRRLMSEI
jgi:hypothetical protein